jgi:hypothetical protein
VGGVMAETQDDLVAIETVTPEELGWESKGNDSGGNYIYRKPDGTLHLFKAGRPPLVLVLKRPSPWERSNG